MNLKKQEFKNNIKKAHLYRFVHHLHFIGGILIPFYTIWGGLSFVQVMLLQAIFTFSMFLLEIPTGVVADKYGRKVSLALAGVVSTIGFFILASYPKFWVFALAEFTLAISASLTSGADQSLVYDSLREIKKEKTSKKVFGRIDSSGLFALMIAGPIGSLIAQHFGLRAVMFAMMGPTIIFTFIALTFKEPEIGRKVAKKRTYAETFKKGIQTFKNNKELKLLAFDYIAISTLAFFLIWVYQVKLQSLNIDIALFGFVHALIVLVQILILNTFVNFEKIFGGKRKYLLWSAILTGIGFIILALAQTITFTLIGISIAAAFGLTRKPLFQNYMNKHIKSAERSTVLSTVSMFYMLSMAIIDIVLGFFVDLNLTYTLTAIGIMIIAFGIISKIEEDHLID